MWPGAAAPGACRVPAAAAAGPAGEQTCEQAVARLTPRRAPPMSPAPPTTAAAPKRRQLPVPVLPCTPAASSIIASTSPSSSPPTAGLMGSWRACLRGGGLASAPRADGTTCPLLSELAAALGDACARSACQHPTPPPPPLLSAMSLSFSAPAAAPDEQQTLALAASTAAPQLMLSVVTLTLPAPERRGEALPLLPSGLILAPARSQQPPLPSSASPSPLRRRTRAARTPAAAAAGPASSCCCPMWPRCRPR